MQAGKELCMVVIDLIYQQNEQLYVIRCVLDWWGNKSQLRCAQGAFVRHKAVVPQW